jgi:hypothetical protein
MHADGVVRRRRSCRRGQSSSWGTSARRYWLWVCECCHDVEGADTSGPEVTLACFHSCWLHRTVRAGASKSGSCQGWDGGGAAQQQPYVQLNSNQWRCSSTATLRAAQQQYTCQVACKPGQTLSLDLPMHARARTRRTPGLHSNWAQPPVADTPAQGTGHVQNP